MYDLGNEDVAAAAKAASGSPMFKWAEREKPFRLRFLPAVSPRPKITGCRLHACKVGETWIMVVCPKSINGPAAPCFVHDLCAELETSNNPLDRARCDYSADGSFLAKPTYYVNVYDREATEMGAQPCKIPQTLQQWLNDRVGDKETGNPFNPFGPTPNDKLGGYDTRIRVGKRKGFRFYDADIPQAFYCPLNSDPRIISDIIAGAPDLRKLVEVKPYADVQERFREEGLTLLADRRSRTARPEQTTVQSDVRSVVAEDDFVEAEVVGEENTVDDDEDIPF
jgi:hypothetical protein